MEGRWTLLVYRIPPHPSRVRLAVWRKLQALGAVYLQDGVAALPARSDLEENMGVVAEDIVGYDGTAFVFTCDVAAEQDAAIRDLFTIAADKRYAEIVEALERAMGGNGSTLGDFEASEQALTRERIAYLRAKRIAYFGGTLESQVEDLLNSFRAKLDAAESQR